MIHGMLADKRVWRDVVRELDLECILAELPSHGAAPEWDGGDYQSQSYELALAQCEAPVHLIGHSFGATVAMRFAAERPGLLASLTLVEPVFFYAAKQTFRAAFDAYCARTQPMADAFEQNDLAAAAAHFLGVWGVPGGWEAMPAPVRETVVAKMPLIDVSAPSLLDDSGDVWDRLGRIECPVMLVTGGRSEDVMTSIHSALEAKIAATSSVRIETAGHMIPVTHGAELGQNIAAFIG